MNQQCFVRVEDERKQAILAFDYLEREQNVDWWFIDEKGHGLASVQYPEHKILEPFCKWTMLFGVEAALAYINDGETKVYLTKNRGDSDSREMTGAEMGEILCRHWKEVCEKGKRAYQKRIWHVLTFAIGIYEFSRIVSLENQSMCDVADSLVKQFMACQEEKRDNAWESFASFLRSVAGVEHDTQAKPIIEDLEKNYQLLDGILGPVEMSYVMTFMESKYLGKHERN